MLVTAVPHDQASIFWLCKAPDLQIFRNGVQNELDLFLGWLRPHGDLAAAICRFAELGGSHGELQLARKALQLTQVLLPLAGIRPPQQQGIRDAAGHIAHLLCRQWWIVARAA